MLNYTAAGELELAKEYFAGAEKFPHDAEILEQCGWYSLLCWAKKKYDEEHVTVAQR